MNALGSHPSLQEIDTRDSIGLTMEVPLHMNSTITRVHLSIRDEAQYESIMNLLKFPRNRIEYLSLTSYNGSQQQHTEQLVEALKGNTTLKHLKFSSFVGLNLQMMNKLVFNDTSIESMCDSNHTLESIRISDGQGNRPPARCILPCI